MLVEGGGIAYPEEDPEWRRQDHDIDAAAWPPRRWTR
jgi:hypothetical protein